jgi:PTH1 family peptidyl-tRNA hydrolase
MSISLVAGLGNPGRDYANTRHNLGWFVLDSLAKKHGLSWQIRANFEAEIARWDFAPGCTRWLMKPLTFMNESGRSVSSVARYYRIPADCTVAVYDDISIDLGLLKISESGRAGGHNGVVSLLEFLGDEFVRFRLGIGPKMPAAMDLKDFVLGNFSSDQSILVNQKLSYYIEGLELLLTRGPSIAMNQLNRREPNL